MSKYAFCPDQFGHYHVEPATYKVLMSGIEATNQAMKTDHLHHQIYQSLSLVIEREPFFALVLEVRMRFLAKGQESIN